MCLSLFLSQKVEKKTREFIMKLTALLLIATSVVVTICAPTKSYNEDYSNEMLQPSDYTNNLINLLEAINLICKDKVIDKEIIKTIANNSKVVEEHIRKLDEKPIVYSQKLFCPSKIDTIKNQKMDTSKVIPAETIFTSTQSNTPKPKVSENKTNNEKNVEDTKTVIIKRDEVLPSLEPCNIKFVTNNFLGKMKNAVFNKVQYVWSWIKSKTFQ